MDITQDIQALTTFRNNSSAFLRRLKKTKRPGILTVNGKAVAGRAGRRAVSTFAGHCGSG